MAAVRRETRALFGCRSDHWIWKGSQEMSNISIYCWTYIVCTTCLEPDSTSNAFGQDVQETGRSAYRAPQPDANRGDAILQVQLLQESEG